MSGHGTKLGRKLEDAVAALLTQRNVEEAARSIHVSTATLMRWQKLPEFQAAYREARRAAYGQAIARLQQGDLGRRHHPDEDHDRSSHAGIGQGTGGRGYPQPRGQGHRDRRH